MMTKFLIVAAVMAALAAAAVAWPLMRDARSRVLGAVAGLLVIGAAAGLYPLWSNWDWNAPPAPEATLAGPAVLEMVAKLEKRLADQPNDLQGWIMLGRSYVALQRFDDAILAFDHAHRLDANDLEATVGLGEAMSIKAGGDITPQAAELFEAAVRAAPDNPKALLFGGFAAAVRGDTALAKRRWLALEAQHPPAEVVQMLDERIAELGPGPGAAQAAPAGFAAGGAAPSAGAAPGAPGSAALAASGLGASDGGAGPADPAARATLNISIAPALQARLKPDAPVFVFAREPGSQGPPLAAKRLTTAAIGTQVVLTAGDSMIPGHALASGQRVSITARVSFSGTPLPAAGDLYGELTYDVGHDGTRDLVIDRVTE
jgi:cytochrome c-type biogenesis protein CcmH